MQDTAVEAIDLSKSYGSVEALKAVDLSIAKGEYFVLLGPSGGGKTTLLRLIGGFLRPTRGQVLINGVDVSDRPPNLRPTSMVFQSYALFPHMTVAQNVGYGLRLKKMAGDEIARRVEAMLATVGLPGYGERRVWELSGGQQQRVQLARALVLETEILLLDEPLAALDAKLRKEMCFWVKQLQERVGITFVHVTHNQEEAMSVADRIAVISGGELIETGSAREVYERPLRRFTADFIGENNILDGSVASAGGALAGIDLGFATVPVPAGALHPAPGDPAAVSIRSERMRIVRTPSNGSPALPARYVEAFYLGLITRHQLCLPDGREVNVRTVTGAAGGERFEPGEEAFVTWETADARLHLD